MPGSFRARALLFVVVALALASLAVVAIRRQLAAGRARFEADIATMRIAFRTVADLPEDLVPEAVAYAPRGHVGDVPTRTTVAITVRRDGIVAVGGGWVGHMAQRDWSTFRAALARDAEVYPLLHRMEAGEPLFAYLIADEHASAVGLDRLVAEASATHTLLFVTRQPAPALPPAVSPDSPARVRLAIAELERARAASVPESIDVGVRYLHVAIGTCDPARRVFAALPGLDAREKGDHLLRQLPDALARCPQHRVDLAMIQAVCLTWLAPRQPPALVLPVDPVRIAQYLDGAQTMDDVARALERGRTLRGTD